MIEDKYYEELINKNIYVSEEAFISENAIILFNSIILGKSIIEENAVIGPNSIIIDSKICKNAQILNSIISNSVVDENTTVGPFASIKKESHIGRDCRIGNFVEIKKSQISDNTKAAHLAYIGDSFIGKRCNFGCGSITVNYDGKRKFQTVIGNDVFIGSNSNIVAPITINDNSFIACGSTITKDVPQNTLAIERSKQINKVDYFKNKQ